MHSKNYCHRDIKPENIFLNKTTKTLKLGDFGSASTFKPEQKFEKIFGTPFYIAPEVLEGDYDYKCDNWSMGVVLFIMLTGKPPFYAKAE